MASNNIILAKPEANSSVDYTLPESDSAKLSFSPEDIDGLKLDGQGGLVISFVEGGSVTISNFQSFIDNGNTLSLADGTNVDPKLLFNALGGENDNPFPADDAIKIGIPAENTTREITLESGKKYVLNFDLSETQGAEVNKDGDMVIGFANGGKIVIADYEKTMAGDMPPELSIASKTCVVTGDELITNIQALAAAGAIPATEEVVVVEEEASKRKSKIADADMQTNDDIGPGDQTDLGYQAAQVEPAAGESEEQDMAEAAQQLAEVEPAAGETAGAARNSGYGYSSRPGSDPFAGKPDIGPIDPTALNYRAPENEPNRFFVPAAAPAGMSIGPNSEFVDETNLAGGPISESGKVNVTFGADGPGGINPNGTFTSDGSKLGGNLTSHGEAVNVTVVGNNYEGRTAGGTLVFKLSVDAATGDYTFTLFEQLDHADGSDPNDQINLHFGIIAYDSDGDHLETSINVGVADDAPSIGDAEETVDETNLGPIIETGNVAVNFGQDGQGTVSTAGTFASSGSQKNGELSSDGHKITVTWTGSGYEGVANGVVVFTLAISSTGGYTYTQYANLDHADPNNPDDIITLKFGVKITDYDGDTDPGVITINVKDDAPRFVDCGCGHVPTPGHAVETIDETNLAGGNIVVTNGISVDFGADAPGTFAFKPGSFTKSGSLKNGNLTHNGEAVNVDIEGGKYVGKTAGGQVIFTLEIDPTTGDYKFTQMDNLDHQDANDPNDIITLKFGFLASDSEGDSVEGSITINVKDDAPIAHDDINNFNTALGDATGNVVTGFNGGPGAADVLSQDDGNRVVKIAFGGTEVDVPAVGSVSIDGDNGKLTISADGSYTYEPFTTVVGGTGVVSEKHFTAGPALPDFNFEPLDPAEQASKGVAAGNLDVQSGSTVHINFVKENGSNHNTVGVFTVDSAGNIKVAKVLVKDTEGAGMQTQSFTALGDVQKVGLFLISGWGPAADPVLSTLDFVNGSLKIVVGYGTPGEREAKVTDNAADIKIVHTLNGVDTVIDRDAYFSSERGGSTSLNPDNDAHVVSGIPGGDDTVLRIGFEDYLDGDYNDAIFDIQIVNKDCGCGCGIGDEFTYTLQDGDGDRDTATLTLNGKDLTNDKPIFTTPAVEIVDETALSGGVITETGSVAVNFGTDGPGTVDAAGTFASSGSRLNNTLSSNGSPITVTMSGDTYVGTSAAGVVVFTLTINTDGSYEFKQFEQLDHADGTNPNDAIDLTFGLLATDCNGDQSTTSLTIRVLDDAPVANDDVLSVNETGTANGNVITGLNGGPGAADSVGQDVPGSVTKIVYKGTTYNVPTDGTNLVINADYGTLSINKDGVYTYQAKAISGGNKKDEFTYTLKDGDGDTDPAKLEINVLDTDDQPEIIKPADEILDETNLAGGPLTETGTIQANFFGDGPGKFEGNNSFSSDGSKLNGNLTHNGAAINVTYDVATGTYTGQTAGGVVVFTLAINQATGGYTFRLLENIDHADGSNPNDVINLHFGIKATDTDGDSVATTLTVKVLDDAPTISGSSGTVDETNLTGGPLTVTGTLVHNYGQDGAGTLVEGPAANFAAGGSLKNGALSSGGSPVTVSFEGGQFVGKTAGGVTVFTLNVNTDGSYTYTQYKGLDHGDPNDPNDEITLSFPAQIVDYDGDKANAPIVITVRDDAPFFPPDNPDNPPEDPENPPGDTDPALGNGYRVVDETNLSGGSIVTNGQLNANFGADAPGSYGLRAGSFTSHGSKLGGTLTSNGSPVTVAIEGGKFVGKTAGGVTVFTLELNSATGAYKFTLLEQLDHADGSNPNDVINLVFGVTASDSEGDTVNGTIRIDVRDDAPVANDDTVNIQENGTANGNVITNDVVGQDTPGTVTKIAYKGTTYNVPTDGSALTINADYGTLTIRNTGVYTYVAKSVNADQKDTFTYTLRDHDGDTDPAKLEICVLDGDDIPEIIRPADEILDETNLSGGPLTETGTIQANFFSDGPGAFAGNNSFSSSGSKLNGNLTHNGQAVNVTFNAGTNTYTGQTAGGVVVFTLVINAATGGYAFKLFEQLDHANGSDPNDVINLTFGIKATDADGDSASTTLTVKVLDDAPVANDDTVNVNEYGTASGNVTNNDSVGQDVAGSVTQIVYKGVTYNVPANGSNLVINADYGTLTINNSGAYTYVAGNVSSDKKDIFTYLLRDHDGDLDPAQLEVCIFDRDDRPGIVQPGNEVVDETNLLYGPLTETGNISANFGDDTPGSFGGTGGFSSSGSKTNGNLSSHGVGIGVSYANGVYTGMAGGVTVFTLAINADGSYTYRQYEQLDHANKSDPNDIINLHFGVRATDSDGDIGDATLTVQVLDDAPNAKNDYCTIYTHESTVSSNALTNDVMGQDVGGRIAQISFGSKTVDVPSSGSVKINGDYGYVTIKANGDYTYTLTNKNAPVTSENFKYKLVDYDGDSDTATMQFNIVKYDPATKTSTGSGGDDVMYGISSAETINGHGGDDWLYGQGGNDILNGGSGNDRLVGGKGNDKLTGGSGADTFLYETINQGVDRITDFNKGSGDKLDLSALLTGFDPLTESINNFVFASHSGGDTTISVNMNGTGSGGATALAVLEGVNVSVTDLFNSGSIIH